MIKIIEGDLLKATEDVIAHQVNCQGVMGSGVALAIKNKWNIAYLEYMRLFREQDENNSTFFNFSVFLGKCQIVRVDNNKYIANLFGQNEYGYAGSKQYTNLNALKEALLTLKTTCKDHNKSIALPYKIGSDRGGADWNEVYKMIDEVFSDYEVTLYKLKR